MSGSEGDRLLSDMNPTARFADRADDYVRFRPTYPPAAIDAMLRDLGEPARLTAADVGAGTGISTRLIAERGVRVLAVEPNAAMRQAAEPRARVEWVDGTAEATTLPGESVELVVAAQAFHWFRQGEAIGEFHRILKPRGRLALIWNNRDSSDPLTCGFIEAIHAVNGEHPAERRGIEPNVIDGSGLFTAPVVESFEHAQALDPEGLVGRARSASYVPKDGASFDRLRGLLEDLHARHADTRGLVHMKYVTRLYTSARK